MKQYFSLGILVLLSNAAYPQIDSKLIGEWTAKFTVANGQSAEAKVNLSESESTWRSLGTNRTNICIGRVFSITVSSPAIDTVIFSINGSKALQGCSDFTLRMRIDNPNMLSGQFPDGRNISMIR